MMVRGTPTKSVIALWGYNGGRVNSRYAMGYIPKAIMRATRYSDIGFLGFCLPPPESPGPDPFPATPPVFQPFFDP